RPRTITSTPNIISECPQIEERHSGRRTASAAGIIGCFISVTEKGQDPIRAGLQRAKREGQADSAIRAALAGGMSVRKTAAKSDVNPSTVQRVAHPFEGADNASVAGAA